MARSALCQYWTDWVVVTWAQRSAADVSHVDANSGYRMGGFTHYVVKIQGDATQVTAGNFLRAIPFTLVLSLTLFTAAKLA